MATYYVDPSGSDANDGLSSATPWKTLAKVGGASLSPGDTVLFKRGASWTENLTIGSSGNPIYPITYDAYGSGLMPTVVGAVSANDRQNLLFKNLCMTGSSGWGFTAQHISGTIQNITLSGCDISYNTTGGILVVGTSALTRATGIVVSNCHVHHNGNVSTGQHGIHGTFLEAPAFTLNEIDHNSGGQPWSSGLYLDTCPNAVIKYNYGHDNHWDNFHMDVNSNGFLIAFNISHGAAHQGYMIEEHLRANGTSLLTNNLSFNDVSSFYLGPGGTIYSVTGVTAVNNIFVNGISRAVGIDVNKTGASVADYLDNTVDYNLYYAPNASGGLMQTVNIGGGRTTYTLAQWRAFTGWDAHSVNVDPKFADYQSDGRGNYHLAAGSPAIGMGVDPGIFPTLDYDGLPFPLHGIDVGPFASAPKRSWM